MIINLEELIKSLSQNTLLEHISQNVELKQNWKQEHGKKISALANKMELDICWLCIGITDVGKLSDNNEKWVKDTEIMLSQHLNQYLDPHQACKQVKSIEFNNRWFIVVEIKNPGAVVYWNNQAYKAAGTSIAVMEPEEIMALTVKLPGLSDFTAQEGDGKFDQTLVKEYADLVSNCRKGDVHFASMKDLSPDQVLMRLSIGKKKVTQILFGNYSFRVVYHDIKDNPVSNEKHEGLFKLIHQSFVDKIQHWTKEQINSKALPYPEKALKEALTNAVAHAAYFEGEGDIIIEIYQDRISISNLCLQESSYFANKWFSRSHKTVNRTLMESLRIAGLVDELGRGKNLIFSESLINGKRIPQVVIEKSGRYNRWRLYLYGGTTNKIQLKLLARLRSTYKDEQKALIANALVLWSNKSVSEIKNFIDGESVPLFAEVLADINGPIFYYLTEDKIILRRWAQVLMGEGQDSKSLSKAEEENLFKFANDMQTKYNNGYITPKRLRELASMGHTKSESVLSSAILKRWLASGLVTSERRGLYKFVHQEATQSLAAAFLARWNKISDSNESGSN